jgi:hypothetical protein
MLSLQYEDELPSLAHQSSKQSTVVIKVTGQDKNADE